MDLPSEAGRNLPCRGTGMHLHQIPGIIVEAGREHEYLRVGFSAPLFEDIEWPLMDSYLKRLH